MKTTEAVQKQLDKILEAFESGSVEGAMAKAITPRHPDDVRPSDAWSFRNRLIMAINGSSDARGFKQWKACDRSVMKGQRAFHILAPCTKKIEDDVTGETRVICVGFKGVAVFDLEQTDGAPMPDFGYEPPAPPRLSDVAERLGVAVTWNGGQVGAYGRCKIDGSAIEMFTHSEPTFWHELAHAADARLQGGKLTGGQVPEQEAVAELAAAVIARVYGAQNDAAAYNYISHYCADGQDAHALAMTVIGRVQQVLELIFETAEQAAAIAA